MCAGATIVLNLTGSQFSLWNRFATKKSFNAKIVLSNKISLLMQTFNSFSTLPECSCLTQYGENSFIFMFLFFGKFLLFRRGKRLLKISRRWSFPSENLFIFFAVSKVLHNFFKSEELAQVTDWYIFNQSTWQSAFYFIRLYFLVCKIRSFYKLVFL